MEKVVSFYNEYIDFIEHQDANLRMGGALLVFRKIFLEFDIFEKIKPKDLSNFSEVNETETTNPLTLNDLFIECFVSNEFYYFKDHLFSDKTWTWDFTKGNINTIIVDSNFNNFILREKKADIVVVYTKFKNTKLMIHFKVKEVNGYDKIIGIHTIKVIKEETNDYGEIINKELMINFFLDKKLRGIHTHNYVNIDDIKEICDNFLSEVSIL